MHTCCASFLNFPCSFERRPSQLFQQSSKQALCSGLSAGLTCGPRAVAGGYPMRNATSTSGIRAGDLGRNLHWAFREQGTWLKPKLALGVFGCGSLCHAVLGGSQIIWFHFFSVSTWVIWFHFFSVSTWER